MPNRHPHLTRRTGYVFILWADKFEEAEAAIFATELRRAGLPVKLIGLTGEWSAGIHGLALLSDLTLGEALPLASKELCVILPCHAATARRLENYPRVLDFFEQANLSGAQFVVKHRDGGPPPSLPGSRS
jgi:putative intracellular protease/amidase